MTRKQEASLATQRARDEAAIRQRIAKLVAAIRAMDIEGVMAMYAPDVVSFDIEPPLQHVGVAAKRENWVKAFSMYQRPLDYEIRNLAITVGDDLAFGYGFIRISGVLKNGHRAERWLRSTVCLRKIDGNWRIVHDQVSAPLDLESDRALLNLEP